MISVKKDIIKYIKKWAKTIEKEIKNKLSWTDNLKNNIEVEVSEDGLSLRMPEYGIFVDSGRKPGKQPPLNVIYKWTKRKNIDPKFAYPIARKIGKEGIEPKPFIHIFDDGLDNLTDELGDEIVRNITDEKY